MKRYDGLVYNRYRNVSSEQMRSISKEQSGPFRFCWTYKQLVIGICATEIFVACISFLFAYYGYKLMSDINERFEEDTTGQLEAPNSIFLYSAFSNYDELINCSISAASVIIAVVGLVGCCSYIAASAHLVLGGMMSGACLFAGLLSMFTSIVTLMTGLPTTAMGSMIDKFAAVVHYRFPGGKEGVNLGVMEALVCVIGANCIGIFTNIMLAVLFALSSSISLLQRNDLLRQKGNLKRYETSNYHDTDSEYARPPHAHTA